MKLEVSQRGLDLFELACRLIAPLADLKLRSQFADATQSVSANIAEGYGRRSLPEYLQFLYTAKGSLGESLTRAIGLSRARMISPRDFEEFDKVHYEVENKLLHLISALEARPATEPWQVRLPKPAATAPEVPKPSTAALRASSVNPARQKAVLPGRNMSEVTTQKAIPFRASSTNPLIHKSINPSVRR